MKNETLLLIAGAAVLYFMMNRGGGSATPAGANNGFASLPAADPIYPARLVDSRPVPSYQFYRREYIAGRGWVLQTYPVKPPDTWSRLRINV